MDKKQFYRLLIAITVIGCLLRGYGVLVQPITDDELHMAFTAKNYIERGHFVPTMPHHPNLRNVLIYLSVEAFGLNPVGLRGFSLLFGALGIPVTGLLMLRLSSSMRASLIAAFFLAIDPVHIAFSVQALQEVHSVFFFLAGTLLATGGLGKEDEKTGLWLLPLSGILFGLGIASKGYALFPLLVCIVFLLYRTLKMKEPGLSVYVVLSLGLVALTVYMLTDAWWFARGYGLQDWIFMKKTLSEVMAVKFIPPLTETNIDSKAWQWFIIPFLGYGSFAVAGGKPYVIMATGNPLTWMLVLPSAVYLLKTSLKTKEGIFVQALFWVSYLPLVFAPRPIFLISSAAIIPLALCIVGIAVSDVAEKKGQRLLYAYLAAVFVAGLLIYPMSIGKALDFGYSRALVERLNPHPGMR